MAKTEQLTLQDIIKSQEANKTGGMSSFMLAQLSAIEKDEKESIKAEQVNNTLTDTAVSELQGINEATHQTVSNIVKLTAAVEKNTKILSTPKSKNDLTEADIQNQKVQADQTGLLTQIVENTTPRPDKVESNLPDFGGLGGLMAGIAIVIGSFIGIIKAQVKAIKLFSEALGIDKLIGIVKDKFIKIGQFFGGLVDLAKDKIGTALEGVVKFFTGTFEKITSAFKAFSGGEAGAVFDAIGEGFTAVVEKLKAIKNGVLKFIMPFVEAFTDAFKIVGEMLSGPVGKTIEGIKGTFGAIAEYFGVFAKSIGKVAGIVGKLFLPITIIMTLWDTVKGAMEGFAKEGIIGGIKGAITGFVNSLILAPLDMIKDAAAWVLGVFGFDKAKDLLKSFNLEDMFTNMVNSVFGVITSIIDYIKGIEIPAVGIDVFGKHIGAGPWHPFGGEDKTPSAASPSAATPATKAPMTAIEPLPAFVPSLDAGGNPIISNGASIAPPQPNTANNVYKQSGTNKTAAAKHPPAQSTPIVVSAPVTNNKTNQQGFFKSPIRNTETSVNAFYKSRFVA